MPFDTEKTVSEIVQGISAINVVQSIGMSGSKDIPNAGEGDIDIFIYCDSIPDSKNRQSILDSFKDRIQDAKVTAFEGGHWGTGDFLRINGVETWLMYFTAEETLSDVEAILNGEYPDKLDNYYYPVGRCAMLESIHTLYEKNSLLTELKKKLSAYPNKLADILLHYHLERLDDTEDLERAVFREDVLFYHFALDLAIDHFLQALFAINKTYFPSRKRTLSFIDKFRKKPENCSQNLLEVIHLGGYPEGLKPSFVLLSKLVKDYRLNRVVSFVFNQAEKNMIISRSHRNPDLRLSPEFAG